MNDEGAMKDAGADRLLARGLSELADVPVLRDVEALRGTVARRAAPELARRRSLAARRWLVAPATLAASIALLLWAVPLPPADRNQPTVSRGESNGRDDRVVERLLDAEVSDRHFRALLFGATDADELLLIAAGETRNGPGETR